MLDFFVNRLKQEGVSTAQLTGSHTMEQRSNTITGFTGTRGPKCLLLSLKVEDEGLNMLEADCVRLVVPWWKPADELQAIKRVHHIGRTNPVSVTRFVTRNLFEERIVALQREKNLLFEATIGGDPIAESKFTKD